MEVQYPANWSHAELGDVLDIQGGSQPPKSQFIYEPREGYIQLLQIRDFGERAVPTYVKRDEVTKFCTKDDVLIARYGASLGRILTGLEGAYNVALAKAIFDKRLFSSRYIYYLLKTSVLQKPLKLISRSAQNGFAKHEIAHALLPIPPLAEQHRIVAKIEELFSELDQGVASLKTAREQLKVYRQSLLKNAFEGKLTAASGWRKKPLGQLLGFLTSGSRGWAAYYATSGDLFVRAQNIKHDRLELDDVAFVALPDKTEGLRTRIQQGDLLITITGANVTKSALVKHDLGTAYVSQHVALCRPTTEILPEYLYWFIVAEAAGRKQLTDMAYGAGKPGLNLENIRSVNVPFPSLHEQQEIVEQIESKLSEADQLDQTLATALQQADALRQSILKKAFCGQLVKQAKNEEPATALLERIRAARATSPAKGRQAKSVSKSLTNC